MTTAYRRPLLAGNWKMNLNRLDAVELVSSLMPSLAEGGCDVLLLPPFVHLFPLSRLLAGTSIQLGAQNVYFEPAGAFTGEVSAPMLQETCGAVLVGHSERRTIFGETDEVVARKLRAVLSSGMSAVLAVGESGEIRDSGMSASHVLMQTDAALGGLDQEQLSRCVIAYEPIWAIGTGKSATQAEVGEMVTALRQHLVGSIGADAEARLRILYGGSVTPANAAGLFAIPGVDGALVGGASLDADGFTAIYHALCASTAQADGGQ